LQDNISRDWAWL